jgi:hypothetical protein
MAAGGAGGRSAWPLLKRRCPRGARKPRWAAEGRSLRAMAAGEKPHDHVRCQRRSGTLGSARPAGRADAHRGDPRGVRPQRARRPWGRAYRGCEPEPSDVCGRAGPAPEPRHKRVEQCGRCGCGAAPTATSAPDAASPRVSCRWVDGRARRGQAAKPPSPARLSPTAWRSSKRCGAVARAAAWPFSGPTPVH